MSGISHLFGNTPVHDDLSDSEQSDLQRLFSMTEASADTFQDVLKKNGILHHAEEIGSDAIPQVAYNELTDTSSGKIRLQHGWQQDDYVWHIATTTPKYQWQVSVEKVIYAIAQTMNSHIPPSIEVKIWPPFADWDIQEITFKAEKLGEALFFDKKNIVKINEALFKMLNPLT